MRKLVQKYQNICSPNLSESISRRSVCQITFASWATLPPFIFPPWGFHLVSSQTKVNWALEDIFFVIFSFWRILFCSIIFYCEAQQIPVGQKLHRCVSQLAHTDQIPERKGMCPIQKVLSNMLSYLESPFFVGKIF